MIKHLSDNKVEVYEYTEIKDYLKKLSDLKIKIAYDENNCNQALYEIFADSEPKATGNIV